MKLSRLALLSVFALASAPSWAESVVTVYSIDGLHDGDNSWYQTQFDAFTKATGITVRYVEGGGGVVVERLAKERTNPQADVLVTAPPFIQRAAAEKLLALCGLSPADIGTPAARELEQQAKRLGHGKLAAELGVGVPTLEDMIEELLRPGRDMRDSLPKPLLRTDVLDMKDLTPGMQLTGTVRNVIDFGAFVDIGVHQDGLVHISQISSRFIRHPSEVLKVGDVVTVWVLSVDLQKKRIALTMKQPKTEQAH